MGGEQVVVLGASPKVDRYAHKAQLELSRCGHTVLPVHPVYREIDGVQVYPSLAAVPRPVDTVTVYLSPEIGEKHVQALLELAPKRVILNPGTESQSMIEALERAGIEVVEGCTLVMLRTGQF